MTDQDWQKILKTIKLRLEDVGKRDIADEDRYEIPDDTRGQSRSCLLAIAMLNELLTEMYSKSSNLRRRSIRNIEQVIENDLVLTEVVILDHSENEQSEDYNRILGKSNFPVTKLRKIISKLRSTQSERQKR